MPSVSERDARKLNQLFDGEAGRVLGQLLQQLNQSLQTLQQVTNTVAKTGLGDISAPVSSACHQLEQAYADLADKQRQVQRLEDDLRHGRGGL